MTGHELGAKVWFHGDEYVVIDEPFEMHGGMMQRARRYENATPNWHTICIPTPEQKQADADQAKAEHADMQAGFARLKKLTATN